jgi:hypothetical protein
MKDVFGRQLNAGDLVMLGGSIQFKPYGIVLSETRVYRYYHEGDTDRFVEETATKTVYKIEHPCSEEQRIYDLGLESYNLYKQKQLDAEAKKREKLNRDKQGAKKFSYDVGDIVISKSDVDYPYPDRYLYLGYLRITDATGMYEGYGYLKFESVTNSWAEIPNYWDNFNTCVLNKLGNNITLHDAFYYQVNNEKNRFAKGNFRNLLSSPNFSLLKNKSTKFGKLEKKVFVLDDRCEFDYSNKQVPFIHEIVEMLP